MLKPFEKKIYLSSPTMHGDELKYMQEAYETNWMSTVGANINEVERIVAEKIGVLYRRPRIVLVDLRGCIPEKGRLDDYIARRINMRSFSI